MVAMNNSASSRRPLGDHRNEFTLYVKTVFAWVNFSPTKILRRRPPAS
jgi:hypothetical protein